MTTALPPPVASHRTWAPDPDRTPVAVLMSGGVDSSVTACLLRDAGCDPVGFTMLVPSACGDDGACCGAHAADVCAGLRMPHYLYDTTALFHRTVIDRFRAAYAGGETPSPCIDCNTILKFGALADAIREHLGITTLATGHYARVEPGADGAVIARAADRGKDQSYFLYGIRRELLADLRLPLGGMTKAAVRDLARRWDLPVAHRPESMELCFAGGGDYRAALGDAAGAPGEIILADNGRVLGTHAGITRFTPGQRHGLGVAWSEPLYVLEIEAATCRVIVGNRNRAFRRRLAVRAVNVHQPTAHRVGAMLAGKIRSGGDPAPCTIVAVDDGTLVVEFAEPVFAPAAGQHLVLYDATDRIVGGGVIDRPLT
jgi:tRNA-specific 2-thiouridylase